MFLWQTVLHFFLPRFVEAHDKEDKPHDGREQPVGDQPRPRVLQLRPPLPHPWQDEPPVRREHQPERRRYQQYAEDMTLAHVRRQEIAGAA